MSKFVISIVITCLSLILQDGNYASCKYCRAYEYLICDSILSLNDLEVSDSLVFMAKGDFFQYFRLESESEMACVLRLDSIDNATRYSSFYNSDLAEIFQNEGDEKGIVFFSKLVDNVLFAEVFIKNNQYSKSYSKITRFNQGERYLFIFDSHGKIIYVDRQTIFYD